MGIFKKRQESASEVTVSESLGLDSSGGPKKGVWITVIILALVAVSWFAFYYYQNQVITKTVAEAEMNFNIGNLDGGIQSIRDALAKDPENAHYLLALATTLSQKGSVDFDEETNASEAIQVAQKALEIEPNSSEAYRVIGYSYEIMEEYDKAHENYDKAIQLDPQNAQAYSNKGHAYDLQGNLKEAGPLYEKALSIEPEEEHALLNYGRYLLRFKNDVSGAKVALNKVVSNTENAAFKSSALQILGEIALGEGNINAGKDYLNQAREIDQENPAILVSLGKIKLSEIEIFTQPEDAQPIVDDVIKNYVNPALEIYPDYTNAYVLAWNATKWTADEEGVQSYRQKALDSLDHDITMPANAKALNQILLTATHTAGEVRINQGE